MKCAICKHPRDSTPVAAGSQSSSVKARIPCFVLRVGPAFDALLLGIALQCGNTAAHHAHVMHIVLHALQNCSCPSIRGRDDDLGSTNPVDPSLHYSRSVRLRNGDGACLVRVPSSLHVDRQDDMDAPWMLIFKEIVWATLNVHLT